MNEVVKIIERLRLLQIECRNPNALTKRTGDYRIGLAQAISICGEFKCKHNWVRTTKNYKPAKKCVECGLIELK